MHKRNVSAERIHILFLLVSQSVGGAETHAISLANGLDEAQFRVSIAYLKDEYDGFDFAGSLSQGVKAFCACATRKLDVRAIRKLTKFVDAEAVDLVVCVNAFPLLYASILRLSCSRDLKIAEILHSTKPLTYKERVQMTVMMPLFRASDLLVYVCNSQRTYWRRNLLAARASQVIYNGVDVYRFRNDFLPRQIERFRAAHNFAPDDYLVGACGNLRPEKAHCDLIDAVGLARAQGLNVKCVLVGDGPMRGAIEASIAKQKLGEHIAITGILSDVRLPIASCDVIIVPSRNETFSMAALEAMAMSKPLIMSDVGGAKELIGHAMNGYLYHKGDIHSLSRHIVGLADSVSRNVLGENAVRTVRKSFTAHAMVQRYARAFTALVREEGRASYVLY